MINVNINAPPPVSVVVSPGIGASTVYSGTATSMIGVAGISPFIAGDNITLSTTGGGITIIGRDPPVTSVSGRTGDVMITAGAGISVSLAGNSVVIGAPTALWPALVLGG